MPMLFIVRPGRPDVLPAAEHGIREGFGIAPEKTRAARLRSARLPRAWAEPHYGLLSGWAYRRTNHPLVGALANALVFAWTIAVTFPLVGR